MERVCCWCVIAMCEGSGGSGGGGGVRALAAVWRL